MPLSEGRAASHTIELKQGEGGMVIMQLSCLPLREIEQALVEIWQCVEEYRMPSPGLTFDFLGETMASMTLRIEDGVLFEILSVRLANWIVTSSNFSAHTPALSAYGTRSEICVSRLDAGATFERLSATLDSRDSRGFSNPRVRRGHRRAEGGV
jgi:hypothetical protein